MALLEYQGMRHTQLWQLGSAMMGVASVGRRRGKNKSVTTPCLLSSITSLLKVETTHIKVFHHGGKSLQISTANYRRVYLLLVYSIPPPLCI
jgi:hypothetical protein